MLRALWALVFLLPVPLGTSQAWAQTTVSGSIAVDTTWTLTGSPYLVSGAIAIQNGAVLTIDAGVTAYMGSGASVSVQSGAIKAQGTASSPIRVLSDNTRLGAPAAPGDWDRWLFGAGTVNTRLEHVLFENGKGLVVNGSAPVFNYLELRNHQGAAITIDLAASPSGVGNQASGNTLNGIAVPAGDVTGSVSWALRGIPYVIGSGVVSVGSSPAISAISPSSLEQGHTVTISLTGSRLAGLATARFDAAGLSAQILPGGTSTQAALSVSAAATAPAGATGLTLLVDAGEIRIPVAVSVERALPVIDTLAPASLIVGQGALDVTVNGRNFTGQSAVLINGNPATTQFLATTQLRAGVANQDAPGTLLFSVRTPDLLNPGQFLVSNTASLPVLAAQLTLSPAISSVPQGASRTLTLTLPFAAPAGGLTFDLVSSAPAVVSVPATLTVPQGGTSVAFQLTAAAVGTTILSASRTGFVSGQAQIAVFAVCPATPSGLVGWWSGEGNANDKAGANNGTLQNGVTFAPGKVGQAFSLDGANDYVDLGSSPAFDLTDFTIHTWISVDPATNTGEHRVLGRDDYSIVGSVQSYGIKSSSPAFCGDGRPLFAIGKNNVYTMLCSPTALSAGFHHLAGVRNGATVSFYVDGALVATQSSPVTGVISPAAPFVLGRVNPSYPLEFFNGLIDEVALHDRALTAQEIAAVYNADSTGMCKQTYTVKPVPLAIPPDGVARSFTIEASVPVPQPIIFTATTLNTGIAQAGSATITLPVGATEATGTITGIAAGSTILRLTPSTPGDPIDTPLAVTTEFASATVVYIRPLGLAKGAIATPAGSVSGPHTARVVGLVKGNPAAPEANTPSDLLLAAPLGLIKGSPTAPEANTPSDLLPARPLGVTKGDPTSPSSGATAGPVLSPPVGLQKP